MDVGRAYLRPDIWHGIKGQTRASAAHENVIDNIVKKDIDYGREFARRDLCIALTRRDAGLTSGRHEPFAIDTDESPSRCHTCSASSIAGTGALTERSGHTVEDNIKVGRGPLAQKCLRLVLKTL